jgi:hypothetical protein
VRSSHTNTRLDASHIGNPKRGSTEAPGAQGSCRVRSTRRAAPSHLSTRDRTLPSRSPINVDVAASNNAGCSRGTKGAVRSKKMEGSGQGRRLLEILRDRKATLLSALSPSHSTAGRRMRCPSSIACPVTRAHLMWKQVHVLRCSETIKCRRGQEKQCDRLFCCFKRQMTRHKT